MEGALANQCHRYIEVDDSCKRYGECKTHDTIQSVHYRQTVVAYVSIDAENKMYYGLCGDTHGKEMVATEDAFLPNFDDGCKEAQEKAIADLKKRFDSQKNFLGSACYEFIVVKDCVRYDDKPNPNLPGLKPAIM